MRPHALAGRDVVSMPAALPSLMVHIAPDSEFLTKYEVCIEVSVVDRVCCGSPGYSCTVVPQLTDKALGQGSYSLCYKCLRKKDGRFFAVKVL